MQRELFVTVATVALMGFSASAFAVDATDKCEAGKLKVAAKYGSCRLKAE